MQHYDAGTNDELGAQEVVVTIPDADLEFVVVPNQALAQCCVETCEQRDSAAATNLHDAWLNNEQHETAAPPTKLQQFTGKCCIQLAAYNPLPALCRAIQDSHSPLESEVFERKQHQLRPLHWGGKTRGLAHAYAGNSVDPENPWDVAGLPTPVDATSLRCQGDLIVKHLSMPIQRAFRQSVLRMLLLAKCSIAVAVCVAVAILPLDEWRNQSEATSSRLPHVMFATSSALYVLTLGLLYGVRHDHPINSAVVAFLLFVEACATLLACVIANEHVIVAGLVLYMVAMAVMYALATCRTKLQASGDFELLHPVLVAALSATLVLAAACALYSSSVAPALSTAAMPSTVFACVLTGVVFAALWTGLVLHCMSESLAPDQYTRCLVLYHSDAVVACCVVPLRATARMWRASVRRARTAAAAALVVRAATADMVTTDPPLPTPSSSSQQNGVEDPAQRFKDYGEHRPALAVALTGSIGASRRRSSIAEVV